MDRQKNTSRPKQTVCRIIPKNGNNEPARRTKTDNAPWMANANRGSYPERFMRCVPIPGKYIDRCIDSCAVERDASSMIVARKPSSPYAQGRQPKTSASHGKKNKKKRRHNQPRMTNANRCGYTEQCMRCEPIPDNTLWTCT